MDKHLWQKGMACVVVLLFTIHYSLLITSCSVSYKFNGASIDYSKTKTIQIAEFPIRASYVWGPMGPIFNNELKNQFADHTKLSQVKRNGDLKLEGEITKYEQRNKGNRKKAAQELGISDRTLYRRLKQYGLEK